MSCNAKIGKTENSADSRSRISRKDAGRHRCICRIFIRLNPVSSGDIGDPIPQIAFIRRPGLPRRGAGRASFALGGLSGDLSGYVCVFATHRRRRRRSGTLERDQKKKIRERYPVSDAAAGGDYLLAVRLMTPPALVTTSRRGCRRRRRRRC